MLLSPLDPHTVRADVCPSRPDPTKRAPSLLHYSPGDGHWSACKVLLARVAWTTEPDEMAAADDACPTCLDFAKIDIAAGSVP